MPYSRSDRVVSLLSGYVMRVYTQYVDTNRRHDIADSCVSDHCNVTFEYNMMIIDLDKHIHNLSDHGPYTSKRIQSTTSPTYKDIYLQLMH